MLFEITLSTPKKIKRLYCKARKWCAKEQKQSFRCRKTHNGCVKAKKSSAPEKSNNDIESDVFLKTYRRYR